MCVCVRESEIEEESWPRSVQFSANICPTFVNSVIPLRGTIILENKFYFRRKWKSSFIVLSSYVTCFTSFCPPPTDLPS